MPAVVPSSWYQCVESLPLPAMRCQSRARIPAFACRPTGWSESEPSFAPWKPIAVSEAAATGSCTWRFPIVARTRGGGRTAVASSGEAIAIGAATVVEALDPNAVRSSVTTPSNRERREQDEKSGTALRTTSALAQTRRLPGARRSHRPTVAHGNADFIPHRA